MNSRSLWFQCRCGVVAAVLLIMGAVPAGADPVVNPSFESGPDPGEAMEIGVGSTVMSGWVVTRAPIDYCGTRWNAAEGARSLGLNGANPGGIAQTLATAPGGEYTVTFYMAGDAFSNPILKHMRVTTGAQSQDYEHDATHAWPWDLGWLPRTFTFTAGSSSTVLEFYSLDPGDAGPTLDNVTIQGPTVDVGRGDAGGLSLALPYPSPARAGFRVEFELPRAVTIRLSLLDVQGREVAVLAHGPRAAGRHAATWDGAAGGSRLPAGLYFVRLATPDQARIHKVVVSG
jgi:choice-of-anchor C domain-containing protein